MSNARLGPFVPRLLGDGASPGIHRVPAAVLFSDLSGYIRLAEQLVGLGRAGAERLVGVIDTAFTRLIDDVHDYQGEVVRFGGDALFVVFTGGERADRVQRAAGAAAAMHATLGNLEAVALQSGRRRLRQSIGIHDGDLVVDRWEGLWREDVVFGPAVSTVLDLERAAKPGATAVSSTVAAHLGREVVIGADGGAVLRRRRRGRADDRWRSRPSNPPHDPSFWLPPPLAEALLAGVTAEHRPAAIAFVGARGLDELCITGHEQPIADALDPLLDALAGAVASLGVVPLCIDVAVDGLAMMLSAGVPVSAGDDTARLLEAARRMVTAPTPLTVRAGVNAGPVFAAVIGHPQRLTYATLGDTANVASRVMEAAAPGTVVATAAALDDVGWRFHLTWQEPVELRGRRVAVQAAEVGPRRDDADRASETPPLRGRAAEIGRLSGALATGGPPLVEVIGPPGIGASRLVEEVVADLERPVWRIESTVDDAGIPFRVAGRILRAAGLDPSALLGGAPLGAGSDTELVGEASARVATAILDHLRGVVLVVDGADHIDASSRRVLERLAVAAGELAATIVVVHHGAGAIEPGETQAHERIELAALADEAVRQIVLDASPALLGEHELRRLAGAAGGNPRLARRLARGDRVGGELPTALEALVAGELDRLPDEVRDLLRAAAVAGFEVDEVTLAAITDRPPSSIRGLAARAPHLLRPAAKGLYRFRDDAVRAAAAGALTVSERRRLARRLAEHREAGLAGDGADATSLVEVAQAWRQTGDDTQVAAWCERAGRSAATAGAPYEAAEQLGAAWRAARRVAVTPEHLVDLAEAWADAASAAGRTEEAATVLAGASAMASDPVRRATILARRARARARLGEYRSAAALVGQAERSLAGTAGATAQQARLMVGLERAQQAFDRGHPARAGALAETLAAEAGALGLARQQAQALALCEMAASVRGRADGAAWGREAYRLAAAAGDELLAGGVACNLGIGLDNRGEWAAALEWYGTAERHFAAAGSPWSVALTALNRSTVLLELGDADEAHAIGIEAHRELAAAGITALEWIATTHLARAAIRRGDAIAAHIERLRAGIDRLDELGEDEVARFREAGLVEALLLDRRAEAAWAIAQPLLAVVQVLGDEHLLPITTRRLLALSARAIGELDTAAIEAATALDAARRLGATSEICFCLHTVLLVERDRGRTVDTALAAELDALEGQLGVVAHPWFPAPPAR